MLQITISQRRMLKGIRVRAIRKNLCVFWWSFRSMDSEIALKEKKGEFDCDQKCARNLKTLQNLHLPKFKALQSDLLLIDDMQYKVPTGFFFQEMKRQVEHLDNQVGIIGIELGDFNEEVQPIT